MRHRAGFTLTELLIVMAILLVLGTISLAVYNTGRSSDRMRSGARVSQSALLGAKDRAMSAKDFRGLRLTRDANGPTFSTTNTFPALVTGFVYVQPISVPPIGNLNGQPSQNTVAVTRPGGSPDATVVVIKPSQGAAFLSQDKAQIWQRSSMQVRIPSGQSSAPGQWYNLFPNPNATGGAYWVSTDANGNQNLILQTPCVAGAPSPSPFALNFTDPTSSIDIQLGNEVLPFHQPMGLPSGVVIDLRYCSDNVKFLAGATIGNTTSPTVLAAPNMDFNFSPRGNVSGATGGLGAFYFCLRDIRDATGPATNPNQYSLASSISGQFVRDPADPGVEGDCLILALNPATGLVQTYDANLTDVVINSTQATGSDGLADNLFYFAQQGKAAGR